MFCFIFVFFIWYFIIFFCIYYLIFLIVFCKFLCILIGCLWLIFFLLFSGNLKGYVLAFYLAVEGHPAHLSQVATLGPACPLHSDRCRWGDRCGWGAALLILIGSHVLSSNCLVRSSSAHLQVGKLGKELARLTWKWRQMFWRRSRRRAREGKEGKKLLEKKSFNSHPADAKRCKCPSYMMLAASFYLACAIFDTISFSHEIVSPNCFTDNLVLSLNGYHSHLFPRTTFHTL